MVRSEHLPWPMIVTVWKAAAGERRLDGFLATVASLLAHHVPLASLAVRRLTRHDGMECLETVVAASSRGVVSTPDDRMMLSAGDHRRFVAWIGTGSAEGERANERRRTRFPFALARPSGAQGRLLLVPLRNERLADVRGVLAVEARGSEGWSRRDRQLLEVLAEACVAAMVNDSRWRDQDRLRDAVDAERQALLLKLGRDDLRDEVVGSRGGLRQVMERIDLVARADVPVLILGETGAGKEVVARSLHQRSARADGPFIRVNCGAIAPELIDSELFGHERGAFTGATATRRGWFERADKGTLFLDEVGELPAAAQVRLLRVLQDGTLDRVGGEGSLHVDVRIVAATHRDLPRLVHEHRFREDLWYRLAVFPILLPPLRDRLEDIPDLARRFARRAAQRFGLPEVPLMDAHIELLRSYHWPGNVRELVSVLDRAVILGGGQTLDIAVAIGAHLPQSPGGPTSPVAPVTLDEAARRHIDGILTLTRGRIEGPSGAAKILGINPHTLRSRMRKLGVEWGRYRER